MCRKEMCNVWCIHKGISFNYLMNLIANKFLSFLSENFSELAGLLLLMRIGRGSSLRFDRSHLAFFCLFQSPVSAGFFWWRWLWLCVTLILFSFFHRTTASLSSASVGLLCSFHGCFFWRQRLRSFPDVFLTCDHRDSSALRRSADSEGTWQNALKFLVCLEFS